MGWSCSCLLVFILWQMMMAPSEAAAIAVGGGVGINIGGEGVWVGGGIINSNPTPAGPSASKLNSAYTALQAWKSAITDDPLCALKSWNGLDLCSYKGVFLFGFIIWKWTVCDSHRSQPCKSSRFSGQGTLCPYRYVNLPPQQQLVFRHNS
ncbi:hypothetical protein GQ457_08G003120 [Hibiscus cannabinus]